MTKDEKLAHLFSGPPGHVRAMIVRVDEAKEVIDSAVSREAKATLDAFYHFMRQVKRQGEACFFCDAWMCRHHPPQGFVLTRMANRTDREVCFGMCEACAERPNEELEAEIKTVFEHGGMPADAPRRRVKVFHDDNVDSSETIRKFGEKTVIDLWFWSLDDLAVLMDKAKADEESEFEANTIVAVTRYRHDVHEALCAACRQPFEDNVRVPARFVTGWYQDSHEMIVVAVCVECVAAGGVQTRVLELFRETWPNALAIRVKQDSLKDG